MVLKCFVRTLRLHCTQCTSFRLVPTELIAYSHFFIFFCYCLSPSLYTQDFLSSISHVRRRRRLKTVDDHYGSYSSYCYSATIQPLQYIICHIALFYSYIPFGIVFSLLYSVRLLFFILIAGHVPVYVIYLFWGSRVCRHRDYKRIGHVRFFNFQT